MNAGGGFTNAGIQGEYYASATALPGTPVAAPYGSPAFTRQDVRIDFNWGTTGEPGGSPDPAFASVSLNNFSVLWSGEVIPKFSETYTFTATTVGGDVLFIRPHGSSTWTTLVNDWSVHGVTADTATYALTAGQTYDIEMEYAQPTSGAAAECNLQWSSFSTPLRPSSRPRPSASIMTAAMPLRQHGQRRHARLLVGPGKPKRNGRHRQQLLAHGGCRDIPRGRRYDDRFRGDLPDSVQGHGETEPANM